MQTNKQPSSSADAAASHSQYELSDFASVEATDTTDTAPQGLSSLHHHHHHHHDDDDDDASRPSLQLPNATDIAHKYGLKTEAERLREEAERPRWVRYAQRVVDLISAVLREVYQYYWLSMVYFCIVSPLAGTLIYLFEGCSFEDAFFMSTSAMTCTGLETIDSAKMSLPSQLTLLFLYMLGSPALATAFPLVIRLYRFQRMFATKPTHFFDQSDITLEYSRRNAIIIMLLVVLFYYFTIQLLAFAFLAIFSRTDSYAHSIYQQQGVDSTWGSCFHVWSAYNNAGFGLFSTGIVPFASEWVHLTTFMFLIIAGNTGFPIGLRLVMLPLTLFRRWSPALQLLSRHPRLFYTHMFSWRQTGVLVIMLFLTNGSQFAFQLGLDWNTSLAGLSPFYKVWNAAFQSISTRNAGFASINLSLSTQPVQFLFVGMMYLAVYPVFSSVRTSQSRPNDSDKWASIRTVLLADAAIVFLSIFVLSLSLYTNLKNDSQFTIFKLIWEVVSAFSNVGTSLGYGNDVTSLSGRFNTVAKLIMIAVMLLGRHRGLPESGDVALAGRPEEFRVERERNSGPMEEMEFAFDLDAYLARKRRRKEQGLHGGSQWPESPDDERVSMDIFRPSTDGSAVKLRNTSMDIQALV